MKTKIILMAALGLVGVKALAQKLTIEQVPAAVKTAFAKKHPDVKTVSWEKEKSDYEAVFKIKGQEVSENYSSAGALLESEAEIKVSDLPKEITAYIAAHHKGVKIKEAAKITKADGSVNYEAEAAGKDLIFDAIGNLIK